MTFAELQFQPHDFLPNLEIALWGHYSIIRGLPYDTGLELWDHESDFPETGLTPEQVERILNNEQL